MIAGIPATDYVGLTRWVLPGWLLRLAEYAGVTLDRIERIVRVISPLAFAPKVPWDRRFLYAATADRLVPPATVRRALGALGAAAARLVRGQPHVVRLGVDGPRPAHRRARRLRSRPPAPRQRH